MLYDFLRNFWGRKQYVLYSGKYGICFSWRSFHRQLWWFTFILGTHCLFASCITPKLKTNNRISFKTCLFFLINVKIKQIRGTLKEMSKKHLTWISKISCKTWFQDLHHLQEPNSHELQGSTVLDWDWVQKSLTD